MIDLGLTGKRAVVAGAGHIPERAGHGHQTSLKLAAAGAAVACIDIDEGRAHGIVKEIEAEGGTAYPVIADMRVRPEVERALDEAESVLGGIDVAVDIIGKANWDRAESFSDEAWAWAIQENLSHVFMYFQTAGQHMIKQGTGGAMVALASVDGIFAAEYHAPYGAAKAGVISLAKTFAHELGRFGIRVNVVAPGNVGGGNEDQPEGEWNTNGINPLAAPRGSDIGNGVLFLCSGLAARVTGQTLVVDGGASIKALWGMSEQLLPENQTRF